MPRPSASFVLMAGVVAFANAVQFASRWANLEDLEEQLSGAQKAEIAAQENMLSLSGSGASPEDVADGAQAWVEAKGQAAKLATLVAKEKSKIEASKRAEEAKKEKETARKASEEEFGVKAAALVADAAAAKEMQKNAKTELSALLTGDVTEAAKAKATKKLKDATAKADKLAKLAEEEVAKVKGIALPTPPTEAPRALQLSEGARETVDWARRTMSVRDQAEASKKAVEDAQATVTNAKTEAAKVKEDAAKAITDSSASAAKLYEQVVADQSRADEAVQAEEEAASRLMVLVMNGADAAAQAEASKQLEEAQLQTASWSAELAKSTAAVEAAEKLAEGAKANKDLLGKKADVDVAMLAEKAAQAKVDDLESQLANKEERRAQVNILVKSATTRISALAAHEADLEVVSEAVRELQDTEAQEKKMAKLVDSDKSKLKAAKETLRTARRRFTTLSEQFAKMSSSN